MEIPVLATELPEGLILEDFEDNWVTNPPATTTDIGEQSDQLLSDDTTPLSTLESEATQSSCMIPIWPTPRTTRSPQTPSHTVSQDLPAVDSFALEPSHKIRGDVEESNIVDGPRTRKPSQRRQAYIAALRTPPGQLPAFHEAYAVRALHQDPRLH